MELKLDLPPSWNVQQLPDGGRRIALEGLEIEIGPLAGLPDEPHQWIQTVMAIGLPPGGRLGAPEPVAAQNDLGWPMEVVTASVLGEGGAVLEQRLGAFYKLNEWVAHVVARGPRVAEARDQLLALMASGRPRWQSPTVIAAISELWS